MVEGEIPFKDLNKSYANEVMLMKLCCWSYVNEVMLIL